MSLILAGIVLVVIVAFIKASPSITRMGGLTLLVGTLILLGFIIEAVARKAHLLPGEEPIARNATTVDDEISVLLAGLPGETAVFRNVKGEYGGIDYLVLNKEHGLFIVKTVPLGSEITLTGSDLLVDTKKPAEDLFAGILRNAKWLKEKIEAAGVENVSPAPVILFTNAAVKSAGTFRGVTVVDRNSLMPAIEKASTDSEGMAKLWSLYKSNTPIW